MQQEDPKPGRGDKPDLPKWMFWEFKFDEIDWRNSSELVIQRVLERGSKEEWEVIVAYYGRQRVIDCLLHEINSLPEQIMVDASDYFGLKKEELKCYTTKRSRPTHWL
jgi:hypothetical protein